MKIEQLLLALIMLVVVVLGIVGIAYIVVDDGCPKGFLDAGNTCCSDYNNNGRCDVGEKTQNQVVTGHTVDVQTGPTVEEVMISKLDAALKALEAKEARSAREGYHCDEYGCYKTSMSQGYDSYYYDDYYRYNHDRDDDEYDLTIRVVDEDNNELEDALVRIEGDDDDDDDDTERTDRYGEAEFNNIAEDDYEVRVTLDGYKTEYEYVSLSRDKTRTIELSPE